MIEKQHINNRDVWIKVKPVHTDRSNPNIIPTEYFTAHYYFTEPVDENVTGEIIMEENGEPKLFESPVAALSYAGKKLLTTLR